MKIAVILVHALRNTRTAFVTGPSLLLRLLVSFTIHLIYLQSNPHEEAKRKSSEGVICLHTKLCNCHIRARRR